MRKNLAAIFGIMILILFYAHAEGAIHIPNSEIQVFGTIGWGMPDYGDPAYTLDENIPRYWDSWDLSQGEIYYLSYKFSVPYSISQIDFYSLPDHYPHYFMGELDIQISQNSTDGLDGDWTTVEHINGDFIPGDTYFSRYPNTQYTSWIRLRMEYQGRGAWGGSPAFYLNEVDFYGDPENQPPISDAGLDQVVYDEATFDGTGSSDPDGSIVSYYWTLQHQTNPDNVRDASGVTPTVYNLSSGFYDVCLTVTNNGGAIALDCSLLAAAGSCFCTTSTMHVESIIAGTIKGKIGKVTVTIFDGCGNPVPAADVTGTFLEGNFDETGSGVTNANGVAVILTTEEVKKPSYKFCVDDVVKGTLTYEPNDNVEDCEIK